MGSQVAKSCLILSSVALLLSGAFYSVQSAPQIPENTLQAAYSAGYQEIRKAPESEIVRVGIGDNSFSRYFYDKTTIYGTSEIKIYENGIFIASIPANQNLNIRTESGMITLFKDDGTVLEESSGPYTITCDDGLLGVRGLRRAGSNALYHGAFEIVKYKQNTFHIVNVIETLKRSKIKNEIIVVDNFSTDNTAKVAKDAGVDKVVYCDKRGKGYAMEAGLKKAKNDIILYMDGDILSYTNDMVEKMLEPLLNDEADFVKSEFDRSGGRVTELVAKPLLEILFPNMYKFKQPLSGIIAGRKDFFEKINFEKDYGVDVGILLDMVRMNARIKEVHIGTIKNDSQSWEALSKMSKEVATAILKRAGKLDDNIYSELLEENPEIAECIQDIEPKIQIK